MGFGKGQQGNTLRLNYKNFTAEIGMQNGTFVFYINGEVIHNLATMQTAITANATANTATNVQVALKANSAAPVFTGQTTMALPIYADIAAAKAAGLTIGKLFQITTTGVVTVVNS